ncbi:hypothetical protein [Microtetraspora malaysiensis]|uniref:hypothetical protein n=1 Tax=Microtetraspora malaysiensis TaxID=161358 RepID=UPI003D8F3633
MNNAKGGGANQAEFAKNFEANIDIKFQEISDQGPASAPVPPPVPIPGAHDRRQCPRPQVPVPAANARARRAHDAGAA